MPELGASVQVCVEECGTHTGFDFFAKNDSPCTVVEISFGPRRDPQSSCEGGAVVPPRFFGHHMAQSRSPVISHEKCSLSEISRKLPESAVWASNAPAIRSGGRQVYVQHFDEQYGDVLA